MNACVSVLARLRERGLRGRAGLLGSIFATACVAGAGVGGQATDTPVSSAASTSPGSALVSDAPTPEAAPVATEPEPELEAEPAPAPAPDDAPVADPAPFGAEDLEKIRAVQPIVTAAAAAHGVEPALINGMIWVESGFDARARGPAGAQGLMQLMPKTAAAMAKLLGRKRNSYDPDFNIHAGALLLARLLDRFDGDLELAIAAYNRGSGIVAGWVRDGEPMPERTRNYVDRVLRAKAWFEAPLPEPAAAPEAQP